MKKTILFTLVFCAFFACLPFGVSAFSSNSLTSLSTTNSSLEAGAKNDVTWTFVSSDDVPIDTDINFVYVMETEGYDPEESGFDFSEADFSIAQLDCDLSEGRSALVTCTSNQVMAAGEYTVTITGATNTSIAGEYYVAVTADPIDAVKDYAASDEFTITGLANGIATLDFQASSTYTGADNTLNVVFTNNRVISAAESILLMFMGESGDPTESGFDYSNAIFSNAAGNLDQVLSCGLVSGMEYFIMCTALVDIAVDTEGYDVIIGGVVNSSTAGDYDMISTTEIGGDGTDVATSISTLTLTEQPVPGKIKKSKLKIKNKKKKSAKLKWKAKANATKYRVILEKKKAKKKGFKQVKKYKNIAKTYKVIKKGKKLLKSKTKYRYKVRAGNAAGWGAWSEYKKFTMK